MNYLCWPEIVKWNPTPLLNISEDEGASVTSCTVNQWLHYSKKAAKSTVVPYLRDLHIKTRGCTAFLLEW
jgi:hypothetical protein